LHRRGQHADTTARSADNHGELRQRTSWSAESACLQASSVRKLAPFSTRSVTNLTHRPASAHGPERDEPQ